MNHALTHSLSQSVYNALSGGQTCFKPTALLLLDFAVSTNVFWCTTTTKKKLIQYFRSATRFPFIFFEFPRFLCTKKKETATLPVIYGFFSAFILNITWSNAYVVCYEFSVGRHCIVDAFISLFDDLTSIVVGFVLKLGTCLCKMIAMSFSCSSNRQSSLKRNIMRCVW